MLKRMRWMGTGVAVGLGASMWLQQKMKGATTRYAPAGMAAAAANRARQALEEGRVAMREKEAELLGRSRSRRP